MAGAASPRRGIASALTAACDVERHGALFVPQAQAIPSLPVLATLIVSASAKDAAASSAQTKAKRASKRVGR